MINTKISSLNVTCFENILEATDYIENNCINVPTIAVALNPEKIVKSKSCDETSEILSKADLLYLDGIGAVKVAQARVGKPVARIPGCELWESLMARCGEKVIPVFLIGATEETLLKTKKKLEVQYNVPIVGAINGYFESIDDVITSIKISSPKVICVAMGSPKQELVMSQIKDSGVNCFMMGVGGTYDVYTGKVKRAPDFFCNLGLEWFYRLLKQPQRILRQLSLLKFLYLYFKRDI